ncbi:UNVERIFIED_CONTAM: hypothetical protein GTU68_008527, partial [Idotea baltica]|nr:hypothetical protein [Idotea baltica]
MQSIAIENNLSETAYAKRIANCEYQLRWFTPGGEVDLCGHATLATAYVLHKEYNLGGPYVFKTRSGKLIVSESGGQYHMDFPSDHAQSCSDSKIEGVLSEEILECFVGKEDYLAILKNEKAVESCNPDLKLLSSKGMRGLIISAPGHKYDFVSRCFYPAYGVDEDPVTGSAHTVLTPYWAMKLRRNVLKARQVSKRGGDIRCVYRGSRVTLIGSAVKYMVADIYI